MMMMLMMTSFYVIQFGFDTWWRLTDPPPSLTHTATWIKDLKLAVKRRSWRLEAIALPDSRARSCR